MAMKSMVQHETPYIAVPAAAATAATAINGEILDKTGFNAVSFFASANYTGGTAGTTYALSLKHGDDDSALTIAVGNDVILSEAPVSSASPVQKIGYIGGKRFVQLVITPSGAAGAANTVGALAVMGKPDVFPSM